MKNLFKGKKAFITIPVGIVFAFALLPFIIGGGLGYLAYKKIGNQKIRFASLAIIGLFTLFFGSAWVVGISSSNSSTAQPVKITPTTKVEQTSVEGVNSPSNTTIQPSPTAQPSPTPQPNTQKGPEAKVVKVVDGDTLDVSLNGKTERIRIIGIDTPETVDPRKTVQCFGKEASDKAKSLLTGQTVQLESDSTQGDKDKYQRLLRYIWLNNGSTDFGKQMIADGYAHEYTYNIPYKYQADYKKAQTNAMNSNKGLWSPTTCSGNTTSQVQATVTPKPVTQQTTTNNSQSQTNTSANTSHSCTGPDLDCSDFKTHAEAQSFFNGCGFTAENDPMKLDSVGVGDGVACESLP